jgi:putative membrane-bound dehydrogenase-like protein
MRSRTAALLLFTLTLLAWSRPAHAQRSPDDELRSLEVPGGFEVSLFACEPMITNPSAIDVDTLGRVWVAEIQWYRGNAKVPPADKIKVLQDTDGDGKADKMTVFAEGVFCPMSVCVAGERVYVATSPDLWVYEDKDGDLVADGPPTKLLTGFGGYNSDHGAHSLVLGPDHKWWMSHGDTGFDVTGTDGSRIQYKWGAMLRGELDGSRLETVAVNFRNPYEICVNSFGQSFCSDNDNDGNFSARICWIMEGGNYGWFGGPPAKTPPGTPFGEHWHFRGHIPGFVPATLVTGFGSPSGICYYEGDAFGPEFKNAPLHTDPGPREVRIYRHEPAGFGMKATNRVFMTSKDDNYFRPDDICTAPDGSLYVSDWYDGGVGGHAYNNPDQGRIFLMRPTDKSKRVRVGKPGPYANMANAIEGLKNPNLATQYLARQRLLADGAASIAALRELSHDAEPNYRARALWLLDRVGGEARQAVVEALADVADEFRALAVRILARHGGEFAKAVLALADDPSPQVRREVLLALPKLGSANVDAALVNLASQYDGTDRYQLEAIHIAAGERKQALYMALEKAGLLSVDKLQLLQALDPKAASDFLVNRLSASGLDEASRAILVKQLGGTASPAVGETVLGLVADEKTTAELRRLAVNLLAANLGTNWKTLKVKPELTAAVKQLLARPEWQLATLALVGDNGLAEVGDDVLALAGDVKTPAETRRKAVDVAAQLRLTNAPAALEPLLAAGDTGLRRAALAALVDLQDWPRVKKLLSAGGSSSDVQSQAVERLMSTSAGALVLLRLIDEKGVPDAVRDSSIAKATAHPDSNVRVLFEKFIPEGQRPQRLGQVIKPDEILSLEADAGRGERIFFQSTAAQCKNCHRVRNAGGGVGPDLSLIGKKYERKTLLETILEPSKAIAPEYTAYVVETEAGQVYAGFLVEESDERLVIKDAEGKLIAVPAGEVAALERQTKSLMPELVLRDVTAQDAADMLAFLTSLTSGIQPVTRFRVLGPFHSPDKRGVERDFGPEADLAKPDLAASYKGNNGKPLQWETIDADDSYGFPAVNQVQHAQRRGEPAEGVTNYYLVFADSAADQDATLLLGSDDSCIVWVDGKKVHEYRGDRALGAQDDRVKVRLKSGRNAIVIKVENHQGPGGVALAISAASDVQLRTDH